MARRAVSLFKTKNVNPTKFKNFKWTFVLAVLNYQINSQFLESLFLLAERNEKWKKWKLVCKLCIRWSSGVGPTLSWRLDRSVCCQTTNVWNSIRWSRWIAFALMGTQKTTTPATNSNNQQTNLLDNLYSNKWMIFFIGQPSTPNARTFWLLVLFLFKIISIMLG